MSFDFENIVLGFKCGPEIECAVRDTLKSTGDVNLKIHLLSSNCLHCNGNQAPEFAAID
jgi:hypothetical protein